MRYILIPLVCFAATLQAQVPRYTQPHLMGTLLNPARAGSEAGMQVAAGHRHRTNKALVRYQASALSLHAPLGDPERPTATIKDHLAWGIVVTDERAGAPRMRTTAAVLALAYRSKVAAGTQVAAGFHAGAMNHWVDGAEGAWASQYNGLAYDASIPSGEQFGQRPVLAPEVGMGLHLQHRPVAQGRSAGYRQMQAGVAVHHLNAPRFSLDREADVRLARKYSAFLSAHLGDGPAGWEPLVLMTLQGGRAVVSGGATYLFGVGGQRGFRTGDAEWAAGIGAQASSDGLASFTSTLRWGAFGGQLSYDLAMTQAQRQAYANGVAELVLFATIERRKR